MKNYWTHTPVGLPLPQFIFDFLLTDADRNRFAKWIYSFGPNPSKISFYLAAQHRRHGQATREMLRSWCKQAKEIPADINEEIQDVQDEYVKGSSLRTSHVPDDLQKKIYSDFPVGRIANIALMRATLTARKRNL
jgi:hypothetical protein